MAASSSSRIIFCVMHGQYHHIHNSSALICSELTCQLKESISSNTIFCHYCQCRHFSIISQPYVTFSKREYVLSQLYIVCGFELSALLVQVFVLFSMLVSLLFEVLAVKFMKGAHTRLSCPFGTSFFYNIFLD